MPFLSIMPTLQFSQETKRSVSCSAGASILPVFDHHGNQLSDGGFKASISGGVSQGDSVRLALYEGCCSL